MDRFRHQCRICEMLGKDRVSSNEIDLLLYSRDLASSIPDELLRGYGMMEPDFVVRPRDAEDVSKVLHYASEHKVPVTPRGAGSTALGGVLPMEGGIVLDLCGMDGIHEFNEVDGYVRVGAGVEWKRLVDYLDRRGYQAGANPSSGPSATIGGYLGSGGGAGIGVTKYGLVGDQVISMKVVLPDGRIVQTNPWDSWLFVGSEGTLGVICEVTLKVFKKRGMKRFLFGFDSLYAGIEAVENLTAIKPYFLTFLDRGMVRLLSGSGVHLLEKEMTIAVAVDGDEEELKWKVQRVRDICAAGVKYRDQQAEEEWENRYKVGLMFKRLGPSLFVQEIRVPIRVLGEVHRELSQLLEGEYWGVESLASDSGTVVLVVAVLGDERRRVEYLAKFSLAAEISKVGLRYHGGTFGIGLHNAYLMRRIHGRGVDVMREIRRRMDPKGLLNPSKTTESRIPGPMIRLSMTMMAYVPWLVYFGLETLNYIPQRLIRLGLRLVGARLR